MGVNVNVETVNNYKYKLTDGIREQTTIIEDETIHLTETGTSRILAKLYANGLLDVMPGYAWDGASGPVVQTDAMLRASCVHDVLYQMIRRGLLDVSFRQAADETMYQVLRRHGVSWFRAQYVYWALRAFGASSAQPHSKI